MSFVLANLLHDSEEVDGREEVPPGEFCDGLLRGGSRGVAHLINCRWWWLILW